jgi:hypothetical protein
MIKFNLTLLFIILTNLSFAQNCDCVSNFEWTKKTFEENDAGFQYIIDKKGQAAYNIHNQLIIEKIKATKNLRECTDLLNEWLRFFRKGHIGIYQLKNDESVSQNISQTAKEPEIWKGNISQFEKYISTKKEADLEGIWELGTYNNMGVQLGTYKIGIQKEDENYIGFIIETDIDNWEKGYIKLKIEPHGDSFNSTFYMRDFSPVKSDKVELTGSNYLQINWQLLKRLSPVFPTEPIVEDYFKMINAKKLYLEQLNETTLYLRIPSFNHHQKSGIDSVLAANKEKILRTENLIIDLRGNGGGSDNSFQELLPFLYTNPIRTFGIADLSTTLNNQRMLDFINNPEKHGFDEEDKEWFQKSYDNLQNNLGKFVNSSQKVYIDTFDMIYEYPKNVGIIIHNENGSSTEQFLLAARQSKKVKFFGVPTMGCVDTGNQYYAESPCKELILSYSLSRSLRVPDIIIDDIGIQPDYYLDKTIPEYKWVEFVNDILNE